MSGKPKGSGKRLTVPVLQGPSRDRRPQPREQQPVPRVQHPQPKRRTTQVEPALPPLRQAVVEDPIPRTNFESRWAKKRTSFGKSAKIGGSVKKRSLTAYKKSMWLLCRAAI